MAASKRDRIANDPPLSRVPAEKRMATVWYIGEHTMWVSSDENPHTWASSSKTALAVASSSTPVVTPLARPVVPEV